MVLARSSGGFTGEEADLARGMGRVLALTVQMLRGIGEVERRRSSRPADELMEERQRQLERLSKIQRSISTRAPLDQVLDAIVAGPGAGRDASRPCGARLRRPAVAVLVASTGVEPELLKRVPRAGRHGSAAGPSSRTAGRGRGLRAGPGRPARFAARRLKAAMAAPVHERVAGQLAIASYDPSGPTAGSSRRCCWPSPSTPAGPDRRPHRRRHAPGLHDPLTGCPPGPVRRAAGQHPAGRRPGRGRPVPRPGRSSSSTTASGTTPARAAGVVASGSAPAWTMSGGPLRRGRFAACSARAPNRASCGGPGRRSGGAGRAIRLSRGGRSGRVGNRHQPPGDDHAAEIAPQRRHRHVRAIDESQLRSSPAAIDLRTSRSTAWRRWSAGRGRTAVWSPRPSSSPWPRRPARSSPSAAGCCARPASRPAAGRPPSGPSRRWPSTSTCPAASWPSRTWSPRSPRCWPRPGWPRRA